MNTWVESPIGGFMVSLNGTMFRLEDHTELKELVGIRIANKIALALLRGVTKGCFQ